MKSLLLLTLFTAHSIAAQPKSCYKALSSILARTSFSTKPVLVKAAGGEMPIARAFEKEGLFYSDISLWFDSVNQKVALKKLFERIHEEQEGSRARILTGWLEAYIKKYKTAECGISKIEWASMTPEARLSRLFKESKGQLFSVVNVEGREKLFLEELLSYDDIIRSSITPDFLTVGDDMGSYEVRSLGGEANRAAYQRQRKAVEEHLDSSVGHQHLVHRWPRNRSARAEMAPRYIELLDSTTWFLYWRQMKRDPEEVESIMGHPYLGVYNRDSLNRLFDAVVEGDPKRFRNKNRMVGARNLKAIPGLGQGHGQLPDFELRSGNKGIKREFVESMLEARFSSGDYSGLRDFRATDFDASASIEDLAGPWLTAADVKVLLKFQDEYPFMAWSEHANSYDHIRNKITAPLLAWHKRLNIAYKLEDVQLAQEKYAKRLVAIAKKYLAKRKELGPKGSVSEVVELREKILEALEAAQFEFSDLARLDIDFERYLRIRPAGFETPKITFPASGPMNVNQIDLGIEYSFRFPEEIANKQEAEEYIKALAEKFKQSMGGGEVVRQDEGGHGHGLSVRYIYTDPKNRKWRVEWDGISRYYRNGKPYGAHGGHIEVPSPKFSPQNFDDVQKLYESARELGLDPRRSAGGAHVNVDLAPLFSLPGNAGAAKAKDLIVLFESNREMISFLWQHPFRQRVAIPVELSEGLVNRLNTFVGGWEELSSLLYEERYFNGYVTRKPSYTQLNATALMGPSIPEEFAKTIDIKNPEVKWYPAFGGKGTDRVEFRLFDAQNDEYMGALQIKYVRALLNKAFNSPQGLKYRDLFGADVKEYWLQNPREFYLAAKAHLEDLGLNVNVFEPLLVEALDIQRAVQSQKPPLNVADEFLSPR